MIPFVNAFGLKQRYSISDEAIEASQVAEMSIQTESQSKATQESTRSESKCDTCWHNCEHLENAHFNVLPVNALNLKDKPQKCPSNKRLQEGKGNFYKSSARFHSSYSSNKRFNQSKYDQPKSPNTVNLFVHTGRSRADCKINVRIGSSVIHTLVDTGAAVSVINTKTYKAL
ncbi:unnamed protein product [Mytilus coruscus]|uniref:Peptidase A2 domain-containing protein n=1 Tax=Mytilus coruscus TaxID=42192 RepID=A0A6J8CG57_MYTCO|nr:unnamed protein product [Mytilus coruscus]